MVSLIGQAYSAVRKNLQRVDTPHNSDEIELMAARKIFNLTIALLKRLVFLVISEFFRDFEILILQSQYILKEDFLQKVRIHRRFGPGEAAMRKF